MVALLGSAVAALAAPATAAVSAPLYPDLRTLRPANLRIDRTYVGDILDYVLRLTNTVWNRGEGPLEVYGRPNPLDGKIAAWQRIYESPAGFRDEYVGEFVWHPSHQHFHFDDFARYELWDRSQFELAERTGFTRGSPQQTSTKVSFCLGDTEHVENDRGPTAPIYSTCNPVLQGISIGWADIYPYYLADQWVDLGTTPPRDGRYVLRSVVDPDNVLFESERKQDGRRESEEANAAVTPFRIQQGVVRIDDPGVP